MDDRLCGSCGIRLSASAKFCSECGTPLSDTADDLTTRGQIGYYIPATGVPVETLLDRGADGDAAEAEATIAKLATTPADGSAILDVWLLRLRALLARAHGDDPGYRDLRDRYRTLSTSLGFERHIDWAEAMA